MRAVLLSFVCVTLLVGCVPSPSAPTAQAADSSRTKPPSCDGSITEKAEPGEGAHPFASQEELTGAVGTTVSAIDSQEIIGAVPGVTRRAVLFGEPFVLCAASAALDPRRVVDEELFQAQEVLVKDAAGNLYNVPLSMISRTAPRFSLHAPSGKGRDFLIAAFLEGLAAKDAAPPTKGNAPSDRRTKEFWAENVAVGFKHTHKASLGLVERIATAKNSDTYSYRKTATGGLSASGVAAGGLARRDDGAPWIEKVKDTEIFSWFLHGAPDVGQRKAFGVFLVCLVDGKTCDEAKGIAAHPPTPGGQLAVGGRIILTVRMAHLPAERGKTVAPSVTVDGQPVVLRSQGVELSYAVDGSHSIVVTAPGRRREKHEVDLHDGKSVSLNIVLLPGSD